MISKSKTFTWKEPEANEPDENGNVTIVVTAGDGEYTVSIPAGERSIVDSVAQIWELHGEPTT